MLPLQTWQTKAFRKCVKILERVCNYLKSQKNSMYFHFFWKCLDKFDDLLCYCLKKLVNWLTPSVQMNIHNAVASHFQCIKSSSEVSTKHFLHQSIKSIIYSGTSINTKSITNFFVKWSSNKRKKEDKHEASHVSCGHSYYIHWWDILD